MKNEKKMMEKYLYQAALKAAEKLEVGSKVRVNPLFKITNIDAWRDGTVTYINKENGWFLVEYKATRSGLPMRNAYQFISIGTEVIVDSEAQITMQNILEEAC